MARKRDLIAAAKLFASMGGHARAAALSPEARKAIARKATKARWAKHSKKDGAK